VPMIDVVYSLIAGLTGVAVYLAVIDRYIGMALKRGIYGEDKHKPDKPRVAESGGIVFLFSVLVVEALLAVIGALPPRVSATVLLVTILAGIMGLVDDFLVLSPPAKILGGLVLGSPILVLGAYDPHLFIPLVGPARFTILYPVAVPLAMTVFANAANMSDTHNGVLHISSIFIYITAIFSGILLYLHGGTLLAVILGLPFLMLHLAALKYNMFPARIFNGDVGSITTGALVGTVALLGKVELAVVLAMMPWVINGYGNIASIKGFRSRHQVRVRPVKVNGWEIERNEASGVPVTLVRLLVGDRSLTEPEIVAAYITVSALSAAAALFIAVLTYTV
jgi:UDP-N-acetylmuramyl pentapeptide phosphotransferase/UDP-N-acetylglucosamine-1-phosphate transferase